MKITNFVIPFIEILSNFLFPPFQSEYTLCIHPVKVTLPSTILDKNYWTSANLSYDRTTLIGGGGGYLVSNSITESPDIFCP